MKSWKQRFWATGIVRDNQMDEYCLTGLEEETPLSISTRSSKHSIVSLEKKLAIETKKQKHELEREKSQIQFGMEQKQKEIDNSMCILEMEQDLKNAVLDKQDEEGSCSIHSNVYENVFLADEVLEGKQRGKSVTE
ncbi:hypothetical protein JTB14_035470 [Gonioctena quinquepunctata]|nr:hypothetical protein JTB14_035470 [Gonioctena quinquepunctata]